MLTTMFGFAIHLNISCDTNIATNNNNFMFILFETLLHLRKDYLFLPIKYLTKLTSKQIKKTKVISKPRNITSVIESLQGNARLEVDPYNYN